MPINVDSDFVVDFVLNGQNILKELIQMLEVRRDDFDENLEDIMESINGILKKTGKGFETEEEEEKEKKEG